MNQGRTSGGEGREAPVEDPVQIRLAMAGLHQEEAEFPIKVEGAHTLPYTSRIQKMDLEAGLLYLKLIRPLPHELANGAPFEMLFAVGDQRFEAPITFRGRESYLLYRFTLPARMVRSDRRRHKRYPFRPREKAYVLTQDSGVPGHGIAGPLVNLSLGGLAFRVDRVVRLDDHLRITPGPGFFDKGKELPMLKIRDLPKLPLFEARGTVANIWERDGEIILGIQFGALKDAELRQLQEVLDAREQMQRAATAPASPTPRDEKPRPGALDIPEPARRIPPAGSLTPDALVRLGRRCTRLVLVMAPGPHREAVAGAFLRAGFHRQEWADDLDRALARLRTEASTASHLLVLETPAGEPPPLKGIRALQRELGDLRELPVALIHADGMPEETEDPLIRPLPWPGEAPESWLPILDDLAGL